MLLNPLPDDKNLDQYKLKQIADYNLNCTLVEKEKLLVTSNFSFSHNVFHSYISLVRQNVALCGNGGILLFLIFDIIENIVGKGDSAGHQHDVF